MHEHHKNRDPMRQGENVAMNGSKKMSSKSNETRRNAQFMKVSTFND